MEIVVPQKSDEGLPFRRKCAIASMHTTYHYIFEHCRELYATQFAKQEETSDFSSDSLDSVEFWHKMVDLIVSVMKKDTTAFDQFPEQLNVGQLAMQIIWESYNNDLRRALQAHAEHKRCKSTDYMNLYFKVKWVYNTYVANLTHYKDATPEFPAYFVPFLLKWLNENDTISMDCLIGAYDLDKSDSFPSCSDRTKFSNSVVDVFSQLNQTLDVLMKMDSSDEETNARMMNIFVKTVDKVLLSYAKMIQRDMPEFVSDDKLACIMMNNVQQLRVNLEKMYKAMGGENLHPDVQAAMNNLQTKLNSILEKVAAVFIQSVEPSMIKAIVTMSDLLCAIEGPISTPEKAAEAADSILDPLMLFLDGELSKYHNQCEKTVLKYLLQELWRTVATSLEKVVITPNFDVVDKTSPKNVPQAVQIASKICPLWLIKYILASDKAPESSLAPHQCTVLEAALDILKEYFHAGGNGLKQAYFGRSAELHSLKHTLGFCALSTDQLIAAFVGGQKELDVPSRDQPIGEVGVQFDLQTNDLTGEKKLIVKILAAKDLCHESTSFKPFIEVSLCGSGLADGKRKFATKSKSGTGAPEYNETFEFVIAPQSECLLVLQLRDYAMFGDNKLMGVAALPPGFCQPCLPLAGLLEKGANHSVLCQLGKSLTVDHTGANLLRILEQRHSDVLAKEFVKLITETCSV